MIDLLLIPVLLFAAFLRFFQLGSLPISLFGDETDIGYQAWSLITTGKDYTGHNFPIYFKSLIEWRLPGLVYLTAPVMGLFGPNSFSVRFLPALFGVLDVYLIFLLANRLFPNIKLKIGKLSLGLGVLAAFLLTITPWHLHYSRAAFDVTLQLFLIVLSIILLISEKLNIRKLTLSVSLAVLSLYVYPTSVIFTPLILISVLLFFKPSLKHFSRPQLLLSGAVVLLISLPYLYSIATGTVSDRIKGINIFNDQKLVDTLITTRTEPWITSPQTERLFHNKAFLYIGEFTNNYLSAFSTDFLFIRGDANNRQSIGGFGELPSFFAPFLLVGLAFSLINIKDKANKLLVFWLLLAPVSSSFTVDGGNHATRLFMMLPPLIVFSSLGIILFLNLIANALLKKLGVIFLFLLSILFILVYWHQYSAHYRYASSALWDYGYSQIFRSLADTNPSGKVYINNTYQPSLIKFAFYTKLPPKVFQQDFVNDTPVKDVVPGFSGFKFGDKYFFGQIDNGYDMTKLLKPGDAYLAAQKYEIPGDLDWSKTPPQGFKVIGSVKDVFGSPLFTLIEKQ